MTRLVSFDTETALIKPGLLSPPLACGSFAAEDGRSWVSSRDQTLRHIKAILDDPAQTVVGQNIAYDFGVICAEDPTIINQVFAKLDAGLVKDTKLREQLTLIAAGDKGSTSLKDTAKKYLNVDLDKSTYRTGYGPLIKVPFDQWDKGAVEYARLDAVTTLGVYRNQKDQNTEDDQTRVAMALHLSSMWGLRTDPDAVHELRENARAKLAELTRELQAVGLIRATGTKDTKKIRMLVEQSGSRKLTDTGQIAMGRAILTGSGNEWLKKIGERSAWEKISSTYVPVLERGLAQPITPRVNPILETGRTSYGDPNLQNIPRGSGIRECFVPRPGFVYVACDYSIAELRALAQTLLDLFGHSDMARALQEGRELHLDFAASLLGISYEDAVKRKDTDEVNEARQLAKAANFGYPGGLGRFGPNTFIDFANAAYGVKLTKARAVELRESWLRKFPEVREFFNYVEARTDEDPRVCDPVILPRTGFTRGKALFNSYCNTYFQGLTAAFAKNAFYAVSRECYTVPTSPLYGSRPVLFEHDAIMLEVPEGRITNAAKRLESVMVSEGQKLCPDIPMIAEPHAMRRWYKKAKPVWLGSELVCWEPIGRARSAA